MSRQIIFSPKAVENLNGIVSFLEKNWSTKVKTVFLKKLESILKILSHYPNSFPKSQKVAGLHQCVITKHNTLYYRLRNNQIEIVAVFDSRQNLEKLPGKSE